MTKCTISIDQEFKNLIPPLSTEELAGLEASILADGCRDALVVWPHSKTTYLLDGHNRHEICQRHDIDFDVVPAPESIQTRDDAKDWIDRNQLARRNLTPEQMSGLRGRIYNRTKTVGHGKGSAGQNGPQNTADALAEEYGVSPRTIKRDGKFAELLESDEGLRQAVREGKPAKKIIKQRHIEEAKESITKQEVESIKAECIAYHEGACVFAERYDKQSVDLLLTDPPYITDVKDISAFAKEWLPSYLELIKPTGRAYVFTGAYPKELAAYLAVKTPPHLKLEQVLVWTYRNTLGQNPKQKYKNNWQAVFYFVGTEAADLDCPLTTEQWGVQDISAPDGRQGDRLHEWQKPIEIGERFIRHSTKAGDTVIDPFACTGTFLIAASKLGRNGYGCDINKTNLEIARSRGCTIRTK